MKLFNDNIIMNMFIPLVIIANLLVSIIFAINNNYQAATYFLLLSFITYLLSPADEEESEDKI